MANNVLTGVVQITAPGAAATFNQVAEGAKKTETALKNIAPATSSSASAITLLGNSLKSGASNFTIIGEAGVRAGSQLRSLSGVLNTTASEIPALTQATQSAGSSILQMAEAFGLAHLAGHILGEVFKSVAEAIFGAEDSFSQIELAAASFEGSLKRLKEELVDFKNQLDFADEIRNIENQLNGLSGVSLKIANAGDKGLSDAKLIGDIDNKVAGLKKQNDNLVKARIDIEKTLSNNIKGSATELGKLLQTGINIQDINGPLLKQLDEADQTIVKQYQDTNKTIAELQKQRGAASNDITRLAKTQQLEIYNQQKEDEKKRVQDEKSARDKGFASYEKYVNDTIAQAKKLSAAFKDSISLKLNIGALDTKQDEFKKSLSFLKDFGDNNFKFTFTPAIDIKNIEFPPADVLPVATEFGTMFSKELNDYFKQPGQITDFGLIQAVNDSKPHAQTAAEKLAATFNNSFSGALAGGLESIGEGIGNALSGKDFGTQIFQVFGSLFSSIGKALIEFGIIRKGIEVIFKNPLIPAVIPIALGIAAVAAGQLFKNIKGARALGGNVGAGDEYLVGENGPEIFRPNTGGRIIPNNQIGTGSSRQQGGLMVQVAGSTTVKGQDLLIAFTLANQSKLRLQ